MYEKNCDAWLTALNILQEIESKDNILSTYFDKFDDKNYSACKSFLITSIKYNKLIKHYLKLKLTREPSLKLQCFFQVVLSDLFQGYKNNILNETNWAQTVNGWIDRAKKILSVYEIKCANALLRKWLEFFEEIEKLPLSIKFSTPEWLINRIIDQYGQDAAEKFLKWNMDAANIYVHTSTPDLTILTKTEWNNFYKPLNTAKWSDIITFVKEKRGYIQDPMTFIPIDLLDVDQNMTVLDLCASPGGKSRQIIEKLGDSGILIAIDLPQRSKQLRENLENATNARVMVYDVLALTSDTFTTRKLPAEFDRIIVDVPCSNTGVIQKKPDVLYRLTERTIDDLQTLQLNLLSKAATFLKRGGKLVYSTCSIDKAENESVIEKFLEKNRNFSLISSEISLPWIKFHDGGACFLLRNIQ